MNDKSITLRKNQAIVVTDMTGWTAACYRAAPKHKAKELAKALVDFIRNTSPIASVFEASTYGAVVGTANHTGDGFIYLSNKAEGVCPIVRKTIRHFDCLVEDLKNSNVPLSKDFAIRIALHYGDVYECDPWGRYQPPPRRSGLADEQGGIKEPMAKRYFLYLGDAINLACKMVSHDLARKYRAVCSDEFLQHAEQYKSFSKEQETTDFRGQYPQRVTIHGLDW